MKKLLTTTALAAFVAVGAFAAQAADATTAPSGHVQPPVPAAPYAQPPMMPVYGPYGPHAAPSVEAPGAEDLKAAQERITRQLAEHGKQMQAYGRQLQAEARKRTTERWTRGQEAWRQRLDALKAMWDAEQEMREASLKNRFGPLDAAEESTRLDAFKAAAEKQRQAMQRLSEANRATADAFAPITRQDMETLRHHHATLPYDRGRGMEKAAEQRREWAETRADAMRKWQDDRRRLSPPYGYAAPYGAPPMIPGQPAPQPPRTDG